MENMRMPDFCIKCGNSLTDKDKKMGLPLCQNCINSLTDTIMGKIRKSDEKKIGQEVDNFSSFILSSGKLFKLDDIAIIQCCFNIFMRETTELEDKNLIISQKIFRDAIKFMERELEKINDKISNDKPTSSAGNDLVSTIDELIQKGMKSGNGADDGTIKDIEKCIDEGRGKGKDEDKEDNKKEDKKGLEKNKDSKSSSKRIDVD